jgi:hypothetical protein
VLTLPIVAGSAGQNVTVVRKSESGAVQLSKELGAVDRLSATAPATGGRTSLDREAARLISWTETQALARPDLYFQPVLHAPATVSAAEKAANKETLALFKRTFSRFLWSGFECSNPRIDRRDRWDQNLIAGLYDPVQRATQVRTLKDQLSIENARLGLPNHLIAPGGDGAPYNFEAFDAIMKDLRGRVKISLDLMHFGLPDAFHNPGQPEKSDFLNPKWPLHFANLALATVQRYPDIEAITLINEPFVTNNFSGSHWNEAVGGDAAFIDRALYMGEAAALARMRLEEFFQSRGTRKIFLHNDSCEFRSDDPAFNAHKRFLTSDLILGADWLLAPKFRDSETFAWLKTKFGAERAGELETRLERIRDLHLTFATKFGKSMKADTVFGMDYYVTCESGPGITHAPEKYRNEAQNTRRGLYEMGMDYFARYRLPLIHAETNMREEKSVEWMTQQLIELSSLIKSGVPVLGATWYSLMDQAGWENGLSSPVLNSLEEAKAAGRLNPIGLISLEDGKPRKVAGLMQALGDELADKKADLPAVGRGSRTSRARATI